MSTCKVSIPVTPKPKQSIRLGNGHAYNPSARGMEVTRKLVKKALGPLKYPLFSGPLSVIVKFFLPAPHSLKEYKRQAMDRYPHIKRPDGDNLEKYLNDALTGVLWTDDARIFAITRLKEYTSDKNGRTEIFVREHCHGEIDYQRILDDIIENLKSEPKCPLQT